MSKKHNYTNYAAIKQPQEETPVAEPEVAVEEVIDEVAEVVEVPVAEEPVVEFKPRKLTGVVVDCNRLNVRKGPSTNNSAVGVLNKGTEVTIEAGGNDEFYEISTPEINGYCMKQFIKITG